MTRRFEEEVARIGVGVEGGKRKAAESCRGVVWGSCETGGHIAGGRRCWYGLGAGGAVVGWEGCVVVVGGCSAGGSGMWGGAALWRMIEMRSQLHRSSFGSREVKILLCLAVAIKASVPQYSS